MDITLLKTFLEVYRQKHFGKAADKLFITQSAVSARIHQMEEQLGVKLFARVRNNIQLTASGQTFLPYAETLLKTWNRACREIKTQYHNRAQLNISSEPGLWDILLEQCLSTLRREMPALTLTIHVCPAETQSRKLAEGNVDLIFAYDPPIEEDVKVHEVLNLPLVLVSSQADIGIHDVFTDRYILVDWGNSFMMSHNRLFPDTPAPAIRILPDNSALRILQSQNAAAYLAKPLVEELVAQKALHLVPDAPLIEKTVYAIHQQNTDRISLIENVLRYLTADKNLSS